MNESVEKVPEEVLQYIDNLQGYIRDGQTVTLAEQTCVQLADSLESLRSKLDESARVKQAAERSAECNALVRALDIANQAVRGAISEYGIGSYSDLAAKTMIAIRKELIAARSRTTETA